MYPEPPLDNVIWHSLRGAHREFSESNDHAVRFTSDTNIFAAVDQCDEAGWISLAKLVGASGVAVLFRDEVPEPPAGWNTLFRGAAHQMVGEHLDVREISHHQVTVLTSDDVAAMRELAALARPGPFLDRTHELGHFVGIRDDGRLIAMAGSRCRVDGHVEISAVCTDPGAQRRGLGSAVTMAIAGHILQSGNTPFLHVMGDNVGALSVYEGLGFRTRRIVQVAALKAPDDAPDDAPEVGVEQRDPV